MPYAGVFLQDLTFIDDGNPKLVRAAGGEWEDGDPDPPLINVDKQRMTQTVINEFLRTKKGAYNLGPRARVLCDVM